MSLFSGIQGAQGEGESDSVEVVGEWLMVGDSTGTLVWILIEVVSGLTRSLQLLRLSRFVASRANKVSLSLAAKVVKLDMISSSERPHVTAWLLKAPLALASGSRAILSGSTTVNGDTARFSCRPGVFWSESEVRDMAELRWDPSDIMLSRRRQTRSCRASVVASFPCSMARRTFSARNRNISSRTAWASSFDAGGLSHELAMYEWSACRTGMAPDATMPCHSCGDTACWLCVVVIVRECGWMKEEG